MHLFVSRAFSLSLSVSLIEFTGSFLRWNVCGFGAIIKIMIFRSIGMLNVCFSSCLRYSHIQLATISFPLFIRSARASASHVIDTFNVRLFFLLLFIHYLFSTLFFDSSRFSTLVCVFFPFQFANCEAIMWLWFDGAIANSLKHRKWAGKWYNIIRATYVHLSTMENWIIPPL